MKVSDILAANGRPTIIIGPNETVGALSRVLHENRIGAVVVSGNGTTIDGVVSERDLAYRLAEHGAGLHALPVSALMTRAVISCNSGDNVSLVASTMLSRNIRHVPVIDGDRLVGMVSIRDVLKVLVGELEHEAAMLRTLVNDTKREPQDR